MKPVWGAVVALALCAVVVTACGGGSTATGGTSTSSPGTGPTSTPGAAASPAGGATATPPPAGNAVDACSLLTDAEIEDVTGYPVKSKTPGNAMGIFENGCEWELDSAAEEIVDWSIDVGVISPGGRRYYDTFLAILEGEPLSGIGDVATQDDVGAVNAVKGDTLVSVFLIAIGADNEDEMTRQLTQTALSHL